MNTRQRRVNHPWARTQAGESAVSVLLGAAIGMMVLSGFLGFWISSSQNSTNQAESAKQEAAATETLNRVRRDVQDSAAILVAEDKRVVLDRKSKQGGTVRTFYRISGSGTDGVIERGQKTWASGAAPALDWPSDAEVIATNVDVSATKFAYQNRDAEALAAPVASPSDVRLVKVNLSSSTNKGAVKLETAAAVDSGRGGAAGPDGRLHPTAENDVVIVVRGSAGTVVDLLANDSYTGAVSVTSAPTGLPTGVTATATGTPGQYRVTATAAANLGPDTAPGSPYEITDTQGVAVGYLRVTVTQPIPPGLNLDVITLAVRDNIDTTAQATSAVLDNDSCDDGTSTGVIVDCSDLPASDVSVSVPDAYPGLNVSVNTDREIVVWAPESYTKTPRTETIRYQVIDSRSGQTAHATLTVTVGPSIVDDSFSGRVGEPVTVNLYGNDRITGTWIGASIAWSGLPSGASFNQATGALTWTPTTAGTTSFRYTVTDATGVANTGIVSGTISNAMAPVSMTAGLWDLPSVGGSLLPRNRIDAAGGDGTYRVYRAATVDGSGNPISPVQLVCGAGGVTCSGNSFYDTTQPGVAFHYFVYDSRTSGAAASPAANQRASARVLSMPVESPVAAAGSDRNDDGAADAANIGVNTLTWPDSDTDGNGTIEAAPMGFFTYDLYGYSGSPVFGAARDLGVQRQLSSAACAGSARADTCWQHTARPRGSESVYLPYSLNQCTVHPSSSMPQINLTWNSVTSDWCPSVSYHRPNISYSNAVQAKNLSTHVTSFTTNEPAATHPRAVRVMQLPPAPSANDKVYSGAAPTPAAKLGNTVADTCTDRPEGETNGVYHCSSNTATVQWMPEGDNYWTDVTESYGPCDWAVNQGVCTGSLRRGGTADPGAAATGGTVIAADVKSPWDPSAPKVQCADGSGQCPTHASFNVTASGNDMVDDIVATACNSGGCASGSIGTLSSYPATPTLSYAYSNPRQYVFYANRSVADDGESYDGSTVNCWSLFPHPNECRYNDDSQAAITFKSANPVHIVDAQNRVNIPASATDLFNFVAAPAKYSWDLAELPTSAVGSTYDTAARDLALFPGYTNTISFAGKSDKTGLIKPSATHRFKPPLPSVGMMMGSPIIRGDALSHGWKYASIWRAVSHYTDTATATTYQLYPSKWIWHQWTGSDGQANWYYNECLRNPSYNKVCSATTGMNTFQWGGYATANIDWDLGSHGQEAPRSRTGWTNTSLPAHNSGSRAPEVQWSSTWTMDQPKYTSGVFAGLWRPQVIDNVLGGTSVTQLMLPFNQARRAANYWQSWIAQDDANQHMIQGGRSSMRSVMHSYKRDTGASYFWNSKTTANSSEAWCADHANHANGDIWHACFPNSIPTDTWTTAVNGKFTVKEATTGNFDNISPNTALGANARGWYATTTEWYNLR